MAFASHFVVTVPAGNVTGSVTDYTLLVSGTYAILAGTGSGGLVTSSVGNDIVFSSDSAGVSILDFERIFYDTSTGKVEYRVRIQLVSGTAYILYCCYGDASVVTYLGNDHGTWPAIYHAVYHVQSPASTAVDSTANANTGISSGVTAAAGQLNGGASFTSIGSNISFANTASYRISTPFTIRCWIKLNSYRVGHDGIIFYFQDGLGNMPFYLAMNGNVVSFGWVNGAFGVSKLDTTVIPLNTWTHVSVVVTGATALSFYINGVFSSSHTSTISAPAGFGTGGAIHMGGEGGNSFLDGVVDELQFVATNMSTTLLSMLYANEFSASTFYTISSHVDWSASCTIAIVVGFAAHATMAYSPSCAIPIVVGCGASTNVAYGGAKCNIALGAGVSAHATVDYESAKCTIPIVVGVRAIASIGTVPLTCLTGSGTGAAVIPPGVDPGFAY